LTSREEPSFGKAIASKENTIWLSGVQHARVKKKEVWALKILGR